MSTDLLYFKKLGIDVDYHPPVRRQGNLLKGMLWAFGIEAVITLLVWGAVDGWRYVGR